MRRQTNPCSETDRAEQIVGLACEIAASSRTPMSMQDATKMAAAIFRVSEQGEDLGQLAGFRQFRAAVRPIQQKMDAQRVAHKISRAAAKARGEATQRKGLSRNERGALGLAAKILDIGERLRSPVGHNTQHRRAV